jgi:1-aminocyclopropane-1-carboxylate deaminase/D-cysteine desulfhydrase-like pyridoxal-dependent ACC family enzyme
MFPALTEEEKVPSLRNICYKGVTFSMLMLDEVHPVLGGNKWFKLIHNLEAFHAGGYKGVVSMAGAYSNHLFALSGLKKMYGIPITCLIRGMDASTPSATLRYAEACGVQLVALSREKFRLLREMPEEFVPMHVPHGFLWIPEGAANEEGIRGCAAISRYLFEGCTDVVLPVATGGTAMGLLSSLPSHATLHGLAVLKGLQGYEDKWQMASAGCSFHLHHASHGGGYAVRSQALDAFIKDFYQETGILSDAVYNGKALHYAVEQLFPQLQHSGKQVMYINTGGLQDGLNLPFDPRTV